MCFRDYVVRFGTKLTPEAEVRASVSVASVYVLVDEGVIPAFASQVYVGRLCVDYLSSS
jgi:hypothetical protein